MQTCAVGVSVRGCASCPRGAEQSPRRGDQIILIVSLQGCSTKIRSLISWVTIISRRLTMSQDLGGRVGEPSSFAQCDIRNVPRGVRDKGTGTYRAWRFIDLQEEGGVRKSNVVEHVWIRVGLTSFGGGGSEGEPAGARTRTNIPTFLRSSGSKHDVPPCI